MFDDEIKKGLGGDAEYPRHLWTATRSEFVTMVKTMRKKKPGCPLTILTIILILMFIFR